MLQSGLASSATLDVPRNSGRVRFEHFGEKSAIPLRLPHASKVNVHSTAEIAALDDRTAHCRVYIGRPICSPKF
jgi:hypothetical protein